MNDMIVNEAPTTTPTTGTSRTAARVALAAAATALAALAVLHVVSPEFDPSWRMVSEYALGKYGWLLALMFGAMAIGSAALAIAIRSQLETITGKLGLGLLLAAAVGMVLSIVFAIPHSLHGLAALIGIPSQALAPLLISRGLLHNGVWVPARRPLLVLANLVWIGILLTVGAIVIGLAQTGGQIGPGAVLGWPNRGFLVAYNAWVLVVAWRTHGVGD